MNKISALLASASVLASSLLFTGCHSDPEPPAGSLYETAYEERSEFGDRYSKNSIHYTGPIESHEGSYYKLPTYAINVYSDEDGDRLNIQGDVKKFFFGLINYGDY